MLKLRAHINGTTSSTSVSSVESSRSQSSRENYLQKDLQGDLIKQLVANDKVITIHLPDGANNLDHYRVHIRPSEGTYRNGFFVFDIQVPQNYPYDPPIVKCITSPVFHPYIFNSGVCISILRTGVLGGEEQGWNPARGLGEVFLALKSLFYDLIEGQLASDPLDIKAAEIFKSDPREFQERVRACIRDASPKESELSYPILSYSNVSGTASASSASSLSASSVNGTGSSTSSSSAVASPPHSASSLACGGTAGSSPPAKPPSPKQARSSAKQTAPVASTSKWKKK